MDLALRFVRAIELLHRRSEQAACGTALVGMQRCGPTYTVHIAA